MGTREDNVMDDNMFNLIDNERNRSQGAQPCHKSRGRARARLHTCMPVFAQTWSLCPDPLLEHPDVGSEGHAMHLAGKCSIMCKASDVLIAF